jgi:hypothetical protein
MPKSFDSGFLRFFLSLFTLLSGLVRGAC